MSEIPGTLLLDPAVLLPLDEPVAPVVWFPSEHCLHTAHWDVYDAQLFLPILSYKYLCSKFRFGVFTLTALSQHSSPWCETKMLDNILTGDIQDTLQFPF